MLAEAVRVEVDAYLARFAEERDGVWPASVQVPGESRLALTALFERRRSCRWAV